MKPIKVGILGAGGFARAFTPLFKAHPQVRSLSIAEILPERRRAEAELAGVFIACSQCVQGCGESFAGLGHWFSLRNEM